MESTVEKVTQLERALASLPTDAPRAQRERLRAEYEDALDRMARRRRLAA